tara:strand:+ start:245 stop:925 length:681 start_codon:yes stop_codon:yes gene_type:complete
MWIKVRTELRHSPKMVTIASRTGVTNVTALGAIVHAWMIADGHADDDGYIDHLNFDTLNTMVGIENLAQAMAEVGWIKEVDQGLQFIDYKEHNGSTAKTRAQNQKRQAKKRKNAVTVKRDGMNTRIEERRGEENKEVVEENPSAAAAMKFANEKFPMIESLRPVITSLGELTTKWHLDRSANGWLTKFGQPIQDWRADLTLYAERWSKHLSEEQKKTPKENYMPRL